MRNPGVAQLDGAGYEVEVKMLAWAMVGSLIGVRYLFPRVEEMQDFLQANYQKREEGETKLCGPISFFKLNNLIKGPNSPEAERMTGGKKPGVS